MNTAPSTSSLLETAVDAVDLARTAAFYTRTLGLAVLLETPRLVAFDAGGASVLLVFQAGATERDLTDERGTAPGHGSRGRVHFALAIPADSLEAWRKRLAALGVPRLISLAARRNQLLFRRPRRQCRRTRLAGAVGELSCPPGESCQRFAPPSAKCVNGAGRLS